MRQIVIPLSPRWRRVGFGCLALVVLGGVAAVGLSTTRFECARSPGAAPDCVLTVSPPLARVEHYPPGSIATVEVFERSGSKVTSPHHFDVTLLDRRGAETVVTIYSTRVAAEAERDRLLLFLADASAPSFVKEVTPRAASYVLFAMTVGFSLLFSGYAFRDAGKIHVRIDRGGDRLDVWRTLFGMPVGKMHSYPLSRVIDVRLEVGQMKDPFRGRGQSDRGDRLAIAFERRTEAATGYLPQRMALERGLAELREALGFVVPRSAPEGNERQTVEAVPDDTTFERDDRDDELAAPMPGAHPGRTRRGRTKVRAQTWSWLRSPFVRLFGGVFLLAAVIDGGLELWAERYQGFVSIRARGRCQFEGATLLPGAEMREALEPGPYTIQVFDPDHPAQYETQEFEIVRGQTTTLSCVPRGRRQ